MHMLLDHALLGHVGGGAIVGPHHQHSLMLCKVGFPETPNAQLAQIVQHQCKCMVNRMGERTSSCRMPLEMGKLFKSEVVQLMDRCRKVSLE